MTMHVDFYNVHQRRMLKVADKIEQLQPYQFDVSRWLSPSGAPSCIASWTVAMFHGTPDRDTEIGMIAATLLGLDREQSQKLFTPRTGDVFPEAIFLPRDDVNDLVRHRITRQWAAATLRHLAATGTVDWHLTDPTRRPQRVPARPAEYISS